VHVFGRYRGLLLRLTCLLHPRTSDMPEHIVKAICEATLGRVAKRKKAPAHDAVIPARTRGKTKMDDETRRYCCATFPLALKLFFGLYPESCRFLKYISRSLLLTPPVQRTGDAPTPGAPTLAFALAFIAGW
jgi:hypothetical protein